MLETIGRALATSSADVHAYCLMTNHYHLLVKADPDRLAAFMKAFGQSYSQWFNRRHERIGPIFAGRFHDVAIESEAQLAAAVRYIALNPIVIDRHDVERYPWSSHGALATGAAPTWLPATLLERFDGFEEYRAFVDAGRDRPDVLIETIRIISDEVAGHRRARAADVRDVALLLADEVGGPLADGVIGALRISTPNARRTAQHRARQRADEAGIRQVLVCVRRYVEVTMAGSGDLR
jgi:REP element-mobilizing transposase RayT